MAAAGHRRRADGLFERESRSAYPPPHTRPQERPRIRQPEEPGPPGPHGHHPHRPASKEGAAPPPVTAGSQERGHDQGTVKSGRPVQDRPSAGAGSAAPRLSTETRYFSAIHAGPGRPEAA